LLLHASINPTSSNNNNNHNKRIGFGQWLLEQALNSPLRQHVLVPQARQKMMQTAQANGIAWEECKSWLASQEGAVEYE
jgi:hypothetical protein